MDPNPADAPHIEMPARFLFQFSLPIRKAAPKKAELDNKYSLPELTSLEGGWENAEVRLGWSESGLRIRVITQGKRKQPRCSESRLIDSDGIHLWINTRPNQDIQRATRFCHQFVFLPLGRGRQGTDPVCGQLLIHRAKEQAPVAEAEQLSAKTTLQGSDYDLTIDIAAAALNGYAPSDNPQLGFAYRIVDQERGNQTFPISEEFPIAENPSLWAWLELDS